MELFLNTVFTEYINILVLFFNNNVLRIKLCLSANSKVD